MGSARGRRPGQPARTHRYLQPQGHAARFPGIHGHGLQERIWHGAGSSRLCNPAPEDFATLRDSQRRLESAERTLDPSELPPATARESSRRLAIQLKEIPDRIELPPWESIPDAQAMAGAEFKRWTIPGTEIRIVRAETGHRAGEYLFGPETVKGISRPVKDRYTESEAIRATRARSHGPRLAGLVSFRRDGGRKPHHSPPTGLRARNRLGMMPERTKRIAATT